MDNSKDALVLTPAQEAIVKKLSKVERPAYDAMSDAEKLGLLSRLSSAPTTMPDDTKFKDVDAALVSIPMHSVATEKNPLGFKAGTILGGRFLGLMNMFSEKPQENWEVIKGDDGRPWYKSGYFKFENEKTGEVFGIYDYSGLHKLKKVCTAATNPAKHTNPLVFLTYIGLVKGRDVLEKEHDIKITTGDQAHVFRLSIEDTADIVVGIRGCVNNLNDTKPVILGDDASMTPQEIEDRNYARQTEANLAYRERQISPSSEQLAH